MTFFNEIFYIANLKQVINLGGENQASPTEDVARAYCGLGGTFSAADISNYLRAESSIKQRHPAVLRR